MVRRVKRWCMEVLRAPLWCLLYRELSLHLNWEKLKSGIVYRCSNCRRRQRRIQRGMVENKLWRMIFGSPKVIENNGSSPHTKGGLDSSLCARHKEMVKTRKQLTCNEETQCFEGVRNYVGRFRRGIPNICWSSFLLELGGRKNNFSV